jgi:hypothetical protein
MTNPGPRCSPGIDRAPTPADADVMTPVSVRSHDEWRSRLACHVGARSVIFPTNSRALSAFRHYVTDLWRRTLRRRSQKDGFTWERMTKLVDVWLPQPRILHPWPDVRFDVKHPR